MALWPYNLIAVSLYNINISFLWQPLVSLTISLILSDNALHQIWPLVWALMIILSKTFWVNVLIKFPFYEHIREKKKPGFPKGSQIIHILIKTFSILHQHYFLSFCTDAFSSCTIYSKFGVFLTNKDLQLLITIWLYKLRISF